MENSRGQYQVAYQIRSAYCSKDLEINPLWNSGKILSDSTAIAWGGPVLKSRERLFWQVRVWNSDGNVSKWSGIASFEMGLINSNDWDAASWIENKDYATGQTSLPYFVKRLTITKTISMPDFGS